MVSTHKESILCQVMYGIDDPWASNSKFAHILRRPFGYLAIIQAFEKYHSFKNPGGDAMTQTVEGFFKGFCFLMQYSGFNKNLTLPSSLGQASSIW